jgi:hypothetical protein
VEREWLDLRALTEYASVSERTLREWIRRPNDSLPAYQIEKKIFVKRNEFDMWLTKHLMTRTDVDVDQIVSELLEGA